MRTLLRFDPFVLAMVAIDLAASGWELHQGQPRKALLFLLWAACAAVTGSLRG